MIIGGGGGGGGGRWLVRAQNPVCFSCSPKAVVFPAIGCSGPLFPSSTNIILPLELLIGFLSCCIMIAYVLREVMLSYRKCLIDVMYW